MYTLPSRLKITFIVLMMIGAAGLGVGFLSAPSTVAEAQVSKFPVQFVVDNNVAPS